MLGEWVEDAYYLPSLGFLEMNCGFRQYKARYIFDSHGSRFTKLAACPELDNEIFAEGVFTVVGNVLTLQEDGEFGYAQKFSLYTENGDVEWRLIWNSEDGDIDGERIIHRRID